MLNVEIEHSFSNKGLLKLTAVGAVIGATTGLVVGLTQIAYKEIKQRIDKNK